MKSAKQVAIWWIRRDLRLADNAALTAARATGANVVPVWINDPHLLEAQPHRDAEKRQAFLHAGLRALADDLSARGNDLIVRGGSPAEVLADLVRETTATHVFAEADLTPYARRRDAAVLNRVPLQLVPGITVHHPDVIKTGEGTPYKVFTPFSRAWKSLPSPTKRDLLPGPRALPGLPGVRSDPLEPTPSPAQFPAGEVEGRRRLRAFVRDKSGSIDRYDEHRDRVDLDGTSGLSPYLRFGMISARTAAVAAIEAGALDEPKSGPGIWLSELIWREFYAGILYHFPRVLSGPFDRRLAKLRWHDNAEHLKAWQEGQTGYPIVDAAMRQLAATGWMHNRSRMIVASFLVKDLLIDWREGERWFMHHLIDGDPVANNGGWQWTAGTGTDAAPYFRVFNPCRQGERADPDGAFVRQWVPELASVPGRAIHRPWVLAPRMLDEFGIRLGDDYPFPIVDHDGARRRTLVVYERARAGR